MSGDKLQSDMLSRIRTYESTPEGFDPHTAPDRLLRRYGLPRHPDLGKEPYLARLWKRAFARSARFVRAELAIDQVIGTRNRLRRGDSEFGLGGNWGGVVRLMGAQTDYPEPATMVFAQWVVPEVLEVKPDGPDLEVAFWVGLDGDPSLEEAAAHQVLQAGIAATVNQGWFSNSVHWRAWIEWYTKECQGPPVTVTNFPVAPGDTVFFLVCAPQPDSGYFSMLNISKGHGASVCIPAPTCSTSDGAPPTTITSKGASAEWIVEATSDNIPIFAPVTFTDCGAGSAHEFFQLEPNGITLNITGPSNIDAPGPLLTRATIVSPTTAVVEELALNWF